MYGKFIRYLIPPFTCVKGGVKGVRSIQPNFNQKSRGRGREWKLNLTFPTFSQSHYLVACVADSLNHRTISGILWNVGLQRRLTTLLFGTLHVQHIDRFHVTSSLSKIQNKRANNVFVLIRHKRRYIYIRLQFYSSIAFFVWNPEHLEFQGYGGAWHKAMIEFVEKYILIPWFWAF